MSVGPIHHTNVSLPPNSYQCYFFWFFYPLPSLSYRYIRKTGKYDQMRHKMLQFYYPRTFIKLLKSRIDNSVFINSILISLYCCILIGNGHSISEHRSTIKTSIPINNQHIQKKVIGDKHSSNRSSSATNQFKHAEQSTDMNISIASTGSGSHFFCKTLPKQKTSNNFNPNLA